MKTAKMLTETIATQEVRRDILLVDRPFAKWTINGTRLEGGLYEVSVSIELAPGWRVTSSSRPIPGIRRNQQPPIIAIPSFEPFGPLSEWGKCRIGGSYGSWLTVRFTQAFLIGASSDSLSGNITVACESENGRTLMIKDDFLLSVEK